MKHKLNHLRHIILTLMLLGGFFNVIAEHPTAFMHFSTTDSVSRTVNYKYLEDIRYAVLQGLNRSNRFIYAIPLWDPYISDFDTIDMEAIYDSLGGKKNAVLADVFVTDLSINERKQKDGQVYYQPVISMAIRFINLEDGRLIFSKNLNIPSNLLNSLIYFLPEKNITVAQALQDLSKLISRDIIEVSKNACPLKASLFDLGADGKEDTGKIQILVDPDDIIRRGDKIDVVTKRKIGEKTATRHIAQGSITRSTYDSIVGGVIRKGFSNIKEAISKNEIIEILIK